MQSVQSYGPLPALRPCRSFPSPDVAEPREGRREKDDHEVTEIARCALSSIHAPVLHEGGDECFLEPRDRLCSFFGLGTGA